MPKFGLIGYPIAHSQSPALFAKLSGGRWEYQLLEYPDFEDAWRAFVEGPFHGVNVTAPYKSMAALRAEILSPEVSRIGAANILVKSTEGIKAYNSDYLAVKQILKQRVLAYSSSAKQLSLAVIGTGGAGRAAIAASEDCGFITQSYHHNDISLGINADVIIYTLPSMVEGYDKLECSYLLEANYCNPCLQGHRGYISGLEWLQAQAQLGYNLLTEGLSII